MKRGHMVAACLLFLLAGTAGCSGKGDETRGKDPRAGKPAVAVDAAKATTGDIDDGIEVVGTLSPKYHAELKSEYGGVVTHVYVTEWARVRKGDPLMKVDTREGEVMLKKAGAALEAAKAALLEAEAAQRRAAREYERSVKLQESGLVTRQELDDARTQIEAADAICSGDLWVRDGRMLQTLILDDRGKPVADVYVCPDNDVCFLMVEGITTEDLSACLAQHVSPDLDVQLEDLRPGHELLSVHGPYAWELMSRWLTPDIIGLPYLSFYRFDRGICFRAGKTGEFGYDLMLRKEHVADARQELLELAVKDPAHFSALLEFALYQEEEYRSAVPKQ